MDARSNSINNDNSLAVKIDEEGKEKEMKKKKVMEFSPEKEKRFLEALEHPGTIVDSWGPGLRGPDPKDPSYKKWKEQNGKK